MWCHGQPHPSPGRVTRTRTVTVTKTASETELELETRDAAVSDQVTPLSHGHGCPPGQGSFGCRGPQQPGPGMDLYRHGHCASRTRLASEPDIKMISLTDLPAKCPSAKWECKFLHILHINFMTTYFVYNCINFAYFCIFSLEIHTCGVDAYYCIYYPYLCIFVHILYCIFLHIFSIAYINI